MLTADLRQAIGRAAGTSVDPGLRPTITAGLYASTAPFHLPGTGTELAAKLTEEPWIASAELTGPGYLTIRVTRQALESVPARIVEAADACVRSQALTGTTAPAPGPLTVDTWPHARDSLATRLTTRLAVAAGAAPPVQPSRSMWHRPPSMPVDATSTAFGLAGAGVGVGLAGAGAPGGPVGEAVGWAGEDAVRFALARIPPHRTPRVDAAKIASHLLDNPAYAVRYAHSRAASVPRWAAAIRPRQVAGLDREELALAYQLSWLPERVAIAARRGRPDEFARYLEELAYGIIVRIGPASNLELAAAARTGLAAGLGLLGITAPDRLLGALEGIHPMSRVAHPAGPRYADVLPADHPPAPPADLNALHPAIWPRGAYRRDGVLTIGDVDVRDLATEFGTPVYVMDEADVRSRCRDYVEAFGDGVFYASKAFCSRALLRWVSQEGLGVDVCTGGELEVALSAGVAPEMITLHGNNKLLSEITSAVEAGVGHVVADSFEEIARLAYVAAEQKTRIRVLVRVTTGVEAHTHEFMATAHDDQKFGFSLGSGDADEAVRRVLACPDLTFAGLHSHIGSQIFDTAGFEVAAHRVLELAKRIQAEHGVAIEELDLGGGFGIAYTPEDDAPDVQSLAKSLRSIVTRQCAEAGLPEPRLTIEPGRAIVGASTVTLYEVGTIKDVDGLRTYVSVDGGMSDNIRTALYDAAYTCVLASRTSDAPPVLSRVVGRHCESGDIVVKDCYLPSDLATGDLLAVAGTGAYCWSLASNYNHLPRPGVVAVRDGAAREIVRRESLDDLLKLDVG